MASNIPQSQFEGLDLTHEEQDSIFTPSVVWDIPSIDLAVLLIGKLFATKDVDIRLLFYSCSSMPTLTSRRRIISSPSPLFAPTFLGSTSKPNPSAKKFWTVDPGFSKTIGSCLPF
ncbi:hypothetical protein V6N13_043473 [Hibiscus sabdariffa]